MSLFGVIVGTFGQLCLGMCLFMVAAFTGGGIANGNTLSSMQMAILNGALFVLPGLCAISAGIVIYACATHGSPHQYWWYVMPIAACAVYLVYALNLTPAG